jgi:8-oxo-dGTP diphosphatase
VRKRRTARVMLFDEGGAVLLVRFVVMRPESEFVFWALPGGEIEAGETEAEAAVREVREELGLELTVAGPVYCDRNQFFHQGEMQDNVDFLFRGEAGARSLG